LREVKLYLSKDFLSWAMHSSFVLALLNMKPQKRPRLSICYVNVASPRQYQTYASILREEGLENIEEAVSKGIRGLPSVSIDDLTVIEGRYLFVRGAEKVLRVYPFLDVISFILTVGILVGAIFSALLFSLYFLGQAIQVFYGYIIFILTSIMLALFFTNIYMLIQKVLLKLITSGSSFASKELSINIDVATTPLCKEALAVEPLAFGFIPENVESIDKVRVEILIKRHDWLRCVVDSLKNSIEKLEKERSKYEKLLRELGYTIETASSLKSSTEKRATARGAWLCPSCGALNHSNTYKCRVCGSPRLLQVAREELSPIQRRILSLIASHGGEVAHIVLVSELKEEKQQIVEALKSLYSRKLLSPVLLTFEGKPSIGYKLSEDARKLLESISSQK